MTRPRKRSAAARKNGNNASDVSALRSPNIEWIKNPNWTWTLVTYLTDHPDVRKNIFSGCTAAEEGPAKQVSKEPKAQQYALLAEVIFSKEPTQADDFRVNPQRYATSVETRLRRLKKEYAEHLKTLGATGAHLAPDEVTPGTPLANLVAEITEKWPWWAELHAFWYKLPHYNPIAVATLTPGHDHAAETDSVNGSANGAEGTEQNKLPVAGTEVDEDVASRRNVESEMEPLNHELYAAIQSKKPMPSVQSESFVDAASRTQFGTDLVTGHGKFIGENEDDVDEFHDTLSAEAIHLRCKRMDHKLSMARAANKRLKYEYEFKEKILAADHEFRLKKIEVDEGNRVTRLEELKLQIELERFRASQVHPVLDTAATPVSTTSQMYPAHIQSAACSNRTFIGEDISVLTPYFPASSSVISLQKAIAQPSDMYDLSQSFGIPLSSTFSDG